MNNLKNALVIRHLAFEDLGSLAEVLIQQDYRIAYREAGVDPLSEINPLQPDLLIILGGPIGVYEQKEYPFLNDELNLLHHRLTADLPTLGICLGSQLMAQALGSLIYPGQIKEIGWSTLNLSEAGKRSPLGYLEQIPVLHWHGDTFNLPAGATHLAATENYENQAFTWGKNGLALQFHPEVTPIGLERWFIGHAAEISATPHVNVTQLRTDTEAYSEQLLSYSRPFWQAWLSSLNGDCKTFNDNLPHYAQGIGNRE
ncbi:MAG: glutamine amidotransferase [Cyanobacteria bacterium J06592_8]